MKKICFLIYLLPALAFAQNFQYGTHFKEGFDAVYITKTTNPGDPYLQKSDTWYGIVQNKKDVVLALEYKSVAASGEPGIFIIENAGGEKGLFNALTKNIILAPEYFDIEMFSEGLAVIKKRNAKFGFDWGAADKNGTIVIPVTYDYLGKLSNGLMNFKNSDDNKAGFLDASNKIVIPPTYNNLSDFSDGLAVAQDASGKFGYINAKNEWIIPAKYALAGPFYHGYATVNRKRGGFGKRESLPEVALINKAGKELTDFSFASIGFRAPNGLFIARQGNQFGALDSTGKLVVPCTYDDCYLFGDDYLQCKINKKYGLINNKGSLVLQPEYDYIGSLNFNRFQVNKAGRYAVLDQKIKTIIPPDSAASVVIMEKRISVVQKDKVKIYDLNGKLFKTWVQPNLNVYGTRMFANGDSVTIAYNASVCLGNPLSKTVKALPYTSAGDFNDEGIFQAEKNSRYDFLDYTGKKLNTLAYYSTVNFTNGVCIVQEDEKTAPYLATANFTKISNLTTQYKGPFSEGLALTVDGNKLVYIDLTGAPAVSVYGSNGAQCIQNRILVVDSYGGYFFYDRKGKSVGEGNWKSAFNFSEGLAAVRKGIQWGFIDTAGNYVITPQYDEVSSFFNGTAIANKSGSFTLIDATGKKIGTDTYTAAGVPGKGGFPVMKNQKVGLVDSKGKTLVDFKYANIIPFSEDRTWALKDGKWGLVDATGKELTGFIFSSCGAFKNGYAAVNKDDLWGLVDKNGKYVFPVEYKNIGSVYKNAVLLLKASGSYNVSVQ